MAYRLDVITRKRLNVFSGGIDMYRLFGKRLIDIVLSLIAIIILSPVYLIIAIVVRIQMGSPILF